MKDLFVHLYKTRFNVILGIVVIALGGVAWQNRFIQDDAFISFRYADHFAKGYGLVWNPGEHIEGYTNFLWTLLLGVGIHFGIEPILLSQLLGMSFFVICLIATYKLSSVLFTSNNLGLLSICVLGTNYTFSSYATGGLETQMQAALFILMCYYCLSVYISQTWNQNKLIILSLLSAAAILTRPDSLLVCAFIFLFTILSIRNNSTTVQQLISPFTILILPIVIIIGGWCIWKLHYYGDILPNTFYVKAGTVSLDSSGAIYCYRFFTSYLLFPIFFIIFFSLRKFREQMDERILSLGVIVCAWCSYIVSIGGDFMEFRFFVPIYPLIAIICLWLIFIVLQQRIIRIIMTLILLGGTLHHWSMFTYNTEEGIETIEMLQGHLVNNDEQWITIGKVLGSTFNYDSTVRIATTASGAIPYYSKLQTIDMLGMNDRWVARNGYQISDIPGHQRIATCRYLLDRQVHLVISHPTVLRLSERITQIPLVPREPDDDVSQATIVEIPIDKEYKLIAIYLLPHPTIEKAIKDYHWKVHPIATQR